MNRPSPITDPAPSHRSYDRRFGIVAYGLLLLTILFFSYLHNFHPHVLSVPDNTDIASWEKPSFPETLINGQVSEEQRIKLEHEGVPSGKDMATQLAGDLLTVLLGLICFIHARKHFGFWMASCFLIGSFAFTGLEESLWILSGRFLGGLIRNPLGEVFYGTYWFTRGGFWFIETPIAACLGWFFIAYSCVLTAGKVFPRMNLWGRAVIGGLIAMVIDLWMDPIQTSPEVMAWVWGRGDVLQLFGIPHYNFLGWFLLIFLFAIFWEKLPTLEERYGRAKATNLFFLIILTVPLLVYIFIWLWMFVLGYLFCLIGVEHALHIPAGW